MPWPGLGHLFVSPYEPIENVTSVPCWPYAVCGSRMDLIVLRVCNPAAYQYQGIGCFAGNSILADFFFFIRRHLEVYCLYALLWKWSNLILTLWRVSKSKVFFFLEGQERRLVWLRVWPAVPSAKNAHNTQINGLYIVMKFIFPRLTDLFRTVNRQKSRAAKELITLVAWCDGSTYLTYYYCWCCAFFFFVRGGRGMMWASRRSGTYY